MFECNTKATVLAWHLTTVTKGHSPKSPVASQCVWWQIPVLFFTSCLPSWLSSMMSILAQTVVQSDIGIPFVCPWRSFTFSSWRLGLPFVLSFLLFNLSLVFSREVGNNMGNCSHKMVVWPLTCLCNRCFHIIICIIHQMCLFIEFVCSYPTVPLCPYYWGFSSSAPLSSFVRHTPGLL